MSMEINNKSFEDDEEESNGPPPPPDGGWGWMVVFGSFMIHIVTDGVTYSSGVFYDEFLVYFNEGQSKTAWIFSLLVGITLCSGPVSSALVNKYGCRPVTIVGSLLASISLIGSVFANNVVTLYITIGVGAGFGFGLIYLPAIVSVTTYFEKKRSLATGIAVCGSGFGTFLLAPLITMLKSEYGWRGAMLIIAGIVLECMIFGALFRPLESETRERLQHEPDTKTLQYKAATIDVHVSDHNLHQLSTNGNGKMQRPHSVAHFSLQKSGRQEHNGNIPSNTGAPRLAVSQPMLALGSKHSYGSQHFRRHGPLDRPDVFYQGSLMNIPSYRSRLDLKNKETKSFIETRHSSFNYKRRKYEEEEEEVELTICGVIPCAQETKDTLNEMLDFSLFKDVIFILFTMSNFLTSIGFNIPYLYIVPKAKSLGLNETDASMLLSIIGITNTIGRIILGYLSDKAWVNRLMIYNWALALSGLATTLSAFCNSFTTLAIYAAVFGFTIGAYVGLTSVILVDLLGLEKLTNAFGLLLLFQGIATLVGPPIAGAMYDATKSHNYGFYLAGITIALSGLMLFIIPPVQSYLLRRPKEKNSVDL